MRVLVVSDSHGDGKSLHSVVDQAQADHVIHCGDFCTRRDQLPKCSLTVVRGNCDWEDVPEEDWWDVNEHRFFVTHGHRYQVRSSLLPVQYRSEEIEATIACFGHTHFPVCEQVGNVLLINPGSLVDPRGFPRPSYAVVEMGAERKLSVTFYTPEGETIPERGGVFRP
ncbi:metallophosphoesterase family protein [Melghirimyces algeriensis]|uniref:Phosphoesterase n=1 Tax=Melghirimyces algeriensis TaxID=910412 RepID=A0A521APH7_9BACL|nr:metallophosphoesterase [Melghirimyces algeriensis]SMO36671.1 hypothetical protein SAMN06264849_101267 [Melghirimyces algeriensis]